MSDSGKNSGNSAGGHGGGLRSGSRHVSRRFALHRQPRRRPKGQVRADINVTPLVDVVLVLLIIFMVVTPMLVRGVAVKLPATLHHDKKSDDGKDIIVSVTSGGDVYVDRDKVPLERVPETVEEAKRRHPEKGIYLKADTLCRYGDVREVMEAVHKANIEDIQLGTDELKTEGGT